MGQITEGILGDGVAILEDGQPIPINEIIKRLSNYEKLQKENEDLTEKVEDLQILLEASRAMSNTLNPPVRTPHACPVCSGKGIVSNGFYSSLTPHYNSISTAPETCRSCSGSGVVWGYKFVSKSEKNE